MTSAPRIGVLALQGDVAEHSAALQRCGAEPVRIRRPAEITGIQGLVLPGGESTTMSLLLQEFELLQPLRESVADGLPVYGSCAGMILLADRLLDGRPDQQTIGGIDMTVRRNAFGRQVDSFEAPLQVSGIDGEVNGVFIRAPWVEQVGPAVEVLASAGDRIVAVRQGSLLATSFHPEVDGDDRIHELFLAMVRAAGAQEER